MGRLTAMDVRRVMAMHELGHTDQSISALTGGRVNQGRSCEIRKRNDRNSKSYHTSTAEFARSLKSMPKVWAPPFGPFVAITRELAVQMRDDPKTPPEIVKILVTAIAWSDGV